MGTMGSPKKGPHAESPNLTMAVAQIWSLFSKNTFATPLERKCHFYFVIWEILQAESRGVANKYRDVLPTEHGKHIGRQTMLLMLGKKGELFFRQL